MPHSTAVFRKSMQMPVELPICWSAAPCELCRCQLEHLLHTCLHAY